MKRAYRRKYHYIYKTTCLATGRYYIGMHSTDDLEDGYVGSGKFLWHSIRKHGREGHKCEILEMMPTRADLRKREAELVNEDALKDSNCMNLKLGGEGGWDHVNQGGQPKHLTKEKLSLGGQRSSTKITKEFFLEHNAKIVISRKARPGGYNAEMKGMSWKWDEATKAKNKVIVKCPHCDKEGGSRAMNRWHFDNCRNIGSLV
jgi:hypothetical protein